MSKERCEICGSPLIVKHRGQVMAHYEAIFLYCSHCRFMQVEDPVWLKEAYEHPMTSEDTGILQRNLLMSRKVVPVLLTLFNPNGHFLDYGGGYGIFTRLMRDRGFDFYWHDPIAPNLFARNFEYHDAVGEIELATAIECFEHFVSPLQEIERLTALSSNILFTTELVPEPVPDLRDWEYYGLGHGQHVSFYSASTLQTIAHRYGLGFYTDNVRTHLFTKRPLTQRRFNRALNLEGRKLRNLTKRLTSKTLSDSMFCKSLNQGGT